jgi:hypothetical protein
MKVSNIEGARSNNTSCGFAETKNGNGARPKHGPFSGRSERRLLRARANAHATRRGGITQRAASWKRRRSPAPPRRGRVSFLFVVVFSSSVCVVRRAKAPKQERIYRKVRRGFTVLPLDGTGPFALVCLCSARVFGDMAGVGSEMERRIGTHGRADGRGEAVRSEYSLPATGIIPRVPCGSFRAPDRRVTACPSPRAPSHRPQHGPHGRRATQAHRHPHRKKARQPAHLDPPLFFSSRRSGDFGCASPFQRP